MIKKMQVKRVYLELKLTNNSTKANEMKHVPFRILTLMNVAAIWKIERVEFVRPRR